MQEQQSGVQRKRFCQLQGTISFLLMTILTNLIYQPYTNESTEMSPENEKKTSLSNDMSHRGATTASVPKVIIDSENYFWSILPRQSIFVSFVFCTTPPLPCDKSLTLLTLLPRPREPFQLFDIIPIFCFIRFLFWMISCISCQ